MDASKLTDAQLDALNKRVREISSFLFELQRRMDQLEWSKADRLYMEVAAARYATLVLSEHVHRLSCRHLSWAKKELD